MAARGGLDRTDRGDEPLIEPDWAPDEPLDNSGGADIDGEDGKHSVPLFPSASDPLGRQGFVRVVNRSAEDATVTIEAYDDSDMIHDPVMLSIGAGETVHFNSNDLELGNAAKGLSGSTGAGMGDWRLVAKWFGNTVLTRCRAKPSTYLPTSALRTGS